MIVCSKFHRFGALNPPTLVTCDRRASTGTNMVPLAAPRNRTASPTVYGLKFGL